MTKTTNGENALSTTFNGHVDLFYNIGSARGAKERAIKLFLTSSKRDPKIASAILAWARDARNGAGERDTYRALLRTLIKQDTDESLLLAEKLLKMTPTIGRFDDLKAAFNTKLQDVAVTVWLDAINDGNMLAHKWVNIKKDSILRNALNLSPRAFRKLIVSGREDTVERKMAEKKWSDIDFEKVPSVCMKKHHKAFRRHQENRFESWLNNDDAKVNAKALFPHQIYEMVKRGENSVANKLWSEMSMDISGNILPMIDVSGSMCCPTDNKSKTTCMSVAVSLGVYLSQNNSGSFKDMYLTFSETPQIGTLKGNSISKIFGNIERSHWGMTTNFAAAYQLILDQAVDGNVPQDEMPQYLVVLSDMQFNEATNTSSCWGNRAALPEFATSFQKMKLEFNRAGYEIPTIVYWNLNANYSNMPACSFEDGVAMVSGFSPHIMKSVCSGNLNRITPESVMAEAIEPYLTMIDAQ